MQEPSASAEEVQTVQMVLRPQEDAASACATGVDTVLLRAVPVRPTQDPPSIGWRPAATVGREAERALARLHASGPSTPRQHLDVVAKHCARDASAVSADNAALLTSQQPS
eukprot:SAG11_NODE_17_length_26125_cov_45.892723_7_plen_111_part_00